MSQAKVDEWLHADRGSPWKRADGGGFSHYDDGGGTGGIDAGSASGNGIGGITPSANSALNPIVANAIQRYAGMSTEQLAELVSRLGPSQQGQTAQKILQQKRMNPKASAPQQSTAAPQQSAAPTANLPPITGAVGSGNQVMPVSARRGGSIGRAPGGFVPPWQQQGNAQGGMAPPAGGAPRPMPPGGPMQSGQQMTPQGWMQRFQQRPPMTQAQQGQSPPQGGWGRPPGMAAPPPQGAPARRGGPVKRADGGDMGISASMASPWWTRREATDSGSGFLHGTTPGRADSIETTAPAGAYVLPADVVAGLGEGNSLAGARVADAIFSSGPHGIPQERQRAGRGPPRPPPEFREEVKRGGAVKLFNGGGTKPVALSHGEYVIGPEYCRWLGNGDVVAGHRKLDAWVLEKRKETIAKMQKLPPPVKPS